MTMVPRVRDREDRPSRRPTRSGDTPRNSLLACGLLLAGATVGVALAGGPPQGALGVFLVFAGFALACCPPVVGVDGRLWLAAAGLVGCAALAFLPERWFGVPAWRQALEALPSIHLAHTVTPVPWETAFWLVVLAMTAVVGLFLLSHPLRSSALIVFAVIATVVSGAYAALAMYAKRTGWHYPFEGGAAFGFFPNRNHTATFLVIGSILSLGVLAVAPRQRRWGAGLLAAASLILCVVALFFFGGSRGGVVFLVVGTVLWMAGLGRTWRSPPLVVSVVTLFVAGGVLLLVSGSEVRNRLFAPAARDAPASWQDGAPTEKQSVPTGRPHDQAEEPPIDFRLLIYRDTIDLIKDYPITGTGLGSFACDFAQYRRASLTGIASVHPESDWLMLGAEAGGGAVFCAVLLAGLAARRLVGLSSHPYWPLRWGCVAAVLVGVLHGLIDVPMHRVTLGWWMVVLAGLGLPSKPAREGKRSRWQHGIFLLVGIGALGLGIQLVRAEWFGGAPLPPFVALKAQRDILATFQRRDLVGAMTMAREAVKRSPMSDALHYQLGVLLLKFEETEPEVDQAFEAQRLLNPTWTEIPLLQGDAWTTIDPRRTASLWLDALARQQRIDRVRHAPLDATVAYYRGLLRRGQTMPAVVAALGAAVEQNPAFVLAWLDAAPADAVRDMLAHLSADDGWLLRFPARERPQFLLSWYVRGDREALGRFLDGHPAWQAAWWPVKLRRLVDDQQYEEAVRQAAEHYHVSLLLPEPVAPGGATAPPGEDDPASLFIYYWEEGNTVAARRVLEEPVPHTQAEPSKMQEFWRLRAALAAHDQTWPAAWQHFQRYLQAAFPEDMAP